MRVAIYEQGGKMVIEIKAETVEQLIGMFKLYGDKSENNLCLNDSRYAISYFFNEERWEWQFVKNNTGSGGMTDIMDVIENHFKIDLTDRLQIKEDLCPSCGCTQFNVFDAVISDGRIISRGICGGCFRAKAIKKDKYEVEGFKMPFGKYKGLSISEIDTSYLKWIVEVSDIGGGIKERAIEVLKEREGGKK